jgi:predicted alpha/beta superfamily hydrolase
VRSLRLLVLFLASATTDVVAQTPWTPMPGGESFTVPSEALGEAREIFVVTPRTFGPDTTRHRVLVLLDGGGLLPPAAGLVAFLQLSAGHASWLLVAVRSTTPNESELRPFVAARFRTNERRGLAGHSLAGLFVVDAFTRGDVTFTDFIAISPTLGWECEAIATRAVEAAGRGRASPVRLFLSTADEGPRYPPEPTRRVDPALSRARPQNVTWRLTHLSGEDHVTTVPPALFAALRWFA